MEWQLIVSEGVHQGQIIPLTRPIFVIGRAAGCHLRPSAASISGRHCILTRRNGKLFAADCPATNGTFINGQRLDQELTLQPGDSLRVGPLVFLIDLKGQQATTAPLREESDDEAIAQILLAMDSEDDDPEIVFDSRPSLAGSSTAEIAARFDQDTQTDIDAAGYKRNRVPSQASAQQSPANTHGKIIGKYRGSATAADLKDIVGRMEWSRRRSRRRNTPN